MRRLLIAIVPAMLCAPAAAPAATVSIDRCIVKGCLAQGAEVVAAPGEANRIRAAGSAGTVEVSDAGARLKAGEGCTATVSGSVRCESVSAISVSAGDGDDEVEVSTIPGALGAVLDGGTGDDLLIGSGGDDRLRGGEGFDRLHGGDGDDELADGDDVGGPDGDVVDGGAGIDLVDYGERIAPVTVRLGRLGAAPAAGQAGEGDRLTGIEGALGGARADVLRASAAGASPNTSDELDGDTAGLSGGLGDDILIGGLGDDRVDATEGADRVRTGPGDDDVTLPFRTTRAGAHVDCGTGFDLVFDARSGRPPSPLRAHIHRRGRERVQPTACRTGRRARRARRRADPPRPRRRPGRRRQARRPSGRAARPSRAPRPPTPHGARPAARPALCASGRPVLYRLRAGRGLGFRLAAR